MGAYDTLVADLEELAERYRPELSPKTLEAWARAAAELLLPLGWRIANETLED